MHRALSSRTGGAHGCDVRRDAGRSGQSFPAAIPLTAPPLRRGREASGGRQGLSTRHLCLWRVGARWSCHAQRCASFSAARGVVQLVRRGHCCLCCAGTLYVPPFASTRVFLSYGSPRVTRCLRRGVEQLHAFLSLLSWCTAPLPVRPFSAAGVAARGGGLSPRPLFARRALSAVARQTPAACIAGEGAVLRWRCRLTVCLQPTVGLLRCTRRGTGTVGRNSILCARGGPPPPSQHMLSKYDCLFSFCELRCSAPLPRRGLSLL